MPRTFCLYFECILRQRFWKGFVGKRQANKHKFWHKFCIFKTTKNATNRANAKGERKGFLQKFS